MTGEVASVLLVHLTMCIIVVLADSATKSETLTQKLQTFVSSTKTTKNILEEWLNNTKIEHACAKTNFHLPDENRYEKHSSRRTVKFIRSVAMLGALHAYVSTKRTLLPEVRKRVGRDRHVGMGLVLMLEVSNSLKKKGGGVVYRVTQEPCGNAGSEVVVNLLIRIYGELRQLTKMMLR